VLDDLPTGVAVPGCYKVKRQAMKAVLLLKLFVEIAQQGIIKVCDGSAAFANEVMVGLAFCGLVARLFSR